MRLADCLTPGGMVVNYGLLSGRPCMLRADQTVFKSITLTGFWLAKQLGAMARQELAAMYGELAGRLASGELAVPIEATYPIEQIQAALAHAGRPGRSGKILVLPNGPVG
jgi:NADPH:quinone reductase-like Zn-dependent oxidoreductase